nr:hypothetical protein [Tanacetum cinerariifolium]
MQTQTSNALHNAIMEAGGKDRPPMLAPDKDVPVTEDNDIYSTVDACPNACEMWKAIERLKQGESINVQDLETNVYWEFVKFTSRTGESLGSYHSRFYKMMNELVRNQCDVTNHQVNVQFLLQLQPKWQRFVTLVKQSQELKTVSYHKLYDILKQHKNEVNEIRAERLARTANPLALKIHKSTNNNLRTSSNTSRANQDNSLRINRGTGYDNQRIVNITGAREIVAKECQKPKWVKIAAYHKEKMLLCKQEEAGFQLNAEQADWRDDTNNEPEDQELEAHYMYMAQIQEVTSDVADNSGPIFDTEPLQSVIIDSLDVSYDREHIDHDDNDDDLANERDLLASLIEKPKCEIDDSKKRNKFLETSNKALVDKLKGVIPPSSVSRPQLKSNQMKDRIMLNNSQGKKQEVEDHHRNVKFSKNKTFVTACNDSLNAKTLNVNFACATCGKCVLNDKHDMCVLHSLNGVNSRTKMPMAVPFELFLLEHEVLFGQSEEINENFRCFIFGPQK